MSEEQENKIEDVRHLKKRLVGMKSRNTTLQNKLDSVIAENERLKGVIKNMQDRLDSQIASVATCSDASEKKPWYARLFKRD